MWSLKGNDATKHELSRKWAKFCYLSIVLANRQRVNILPIRPGKWGFVEIDLGEFSIGKHQTEHFISVQADLNLCVDWASHSAL